jgi:hypothetical protein
MVGGCKGVFYKGVKKNLAQHGVDEKIIRYNLEAYRMNFPNFICGNLISIEVLGHDEKTKSKAQWNNLREEVHIEEPHDLKSGIIEKEEV